jgi:hypothetical protein
MTNLLLIWLKRDQESPNFDEEWSYDHITRCHFPRATPAYPARLAGGVSPGHSAAVNASDPLRFACMDCGSRQAAAGDCSKCGKGPVMDLSDGEVRLALVDDDDRRRSGRDRRMVVVSIPIALATFGLLCLVPGFTVLFWALPGPFLIKFIAGVSAGAYGISRLLLRLFPVRQHFKDLA